MDFAGPAADDARRTAVRDWLADHPSPSARELAAAGYVAPGWPPPWGLGADPEHQLIIAEELATAGIERPDNPIGIGWAGPTIVAGGTPEQQARWLPGLLDGSEFWCQLFSEPEAGSDLAALSTRAERDGDHYVINGSKLWSSMANKAQRGILLARTGPPPGPDVPKHRGISYFGIDMATPGIEIRPIIEMTGGNHFNETFFTDVRVPVEDRIGDEGDGWRLATVTLNNERISLSEGGLLWGDGPNTADFFAAVRSHPELRAAAADPLVRQRLADAFTHWRILELLGARVVSQLLRGGDPGPIASIRKALADEHGQRVTGLMKDLHGASGMLGTQTPATKDDDPWHWGFLFSPALTVGGGTAQVQRNIIGERLLGLPR